MASSVAVQLSNTSLAWIERVAISVTPSQEANQEQPQSPEQKESSWAPLSASPGRLGWSSRFVDWTERTALAQRHLGRLA